MLEPYYSAFSEFVNSQNQFVRNVVGEFGDVKVLIHSIQYSLHRRVQSFHSCLE